MVEVRKRFDTARTGWYEIRKEALADLKMATGDQWKPEVKQAVQQMWQEEENIQGIDTSEVRAMMEYLGRGNPPGQKPG